PFPLAINTMGSLKRMALCLGTSSVQDAADQLGALLKAKPPTSFKDAIKLLGTAIELRHAKPRLVKDGPCKEYIQKFEPVPTRVDAWPPAPSIVPAPAALEQSQARWPTLGDLPILKCWPLDAGRFLTLPCVVTKDPDTGERNVGMYRMQVY